MARCPDSKFVEVDSPREGLIVFHDDTGESEVSLRSGKALSELWERSALPPYLDIMGLAHRIWAALLRAALSTGLDIRVVDVEPLRYRFNRIRTEGELLTSRHGLME
jgi:hypothetical protein